MTPKENTIARLKELIAILESDVEVLHAECSMRLGEPLSMGLDGTKWSTVYAVKIEMKSQKGNA